MHARFYAPGAASGVALALPAEEAQHLTRVMRLKRGDPVRVFDGRGGEFDAVVDRAGRGEAVVLIGAARDSAAREPGVAVTLAQAVLKGDRMDVVVRDAVMMGVAAIQPVVATRSEVSLASLARGGRRERWERIAVSSAKQCGRAVVPIIHAPVALDFDALEEPAFALVEPGAAPEVAGLADLPSDRPDRATILVGPEGGWTPEEVRRASEACRLVTLGGRTLRADAVAVVALSAFFTLWKEF